MPMVLIATKKSAVPTDGIERAIAETQPGSSAAPQEVPPLLDRNRPPAQVPAYSVVVAGFAAPRGSTMIWTTLFGARFCGAPQDWPLVLDTWTSPAAVPR